MKLWRLGALVQVKLAVNSKTSSNDCRRQCFSSQLICISSRVCIWVRYRASEFKLKKFSSSVHRQNNTRQQTKQRRMKRGQICKYYEPKQFFSASLHLFLEILLVLFFSFGNASPIYLISRFAHSKRQWQGKSRKFSNIFFKISVLSYASCRLIKCKRDLN